MFSTVPWQYAVQTIIILLISIDVHELAHAIVADRLGDPTPGQRGELSLNPFVHMDQIGIILLLLTSFTGFGFTYGRTHVTPQNLRFGPQRGGALVAVAGPLSNLVLAALAGFVLSASLGGTLSLRPDVQNFLLLAMILNILLFVLNLIPIPPLDGFTILGGFLTARQMYSLAPLEQWGPLIILFLFLTNNQLGLLNTVLDPAMSHLSQVLCRNCSALPYG